MDSDLLGPPEPAEPAEPDQPAEPSAESLPAEVSPNAPVLIPADQYDRSQWLGSSDIAAVLGVSPWRNAVDVWLDKTAPRVIEAAESLAMKRGKRMEPVVLDWAAEDYHLVVWHRNRRFGLPAQRFAAELDGEVAEVGEGASYDEARLQNAEVKTASAFMAREWGQQWESPDALPLHYLCQTQWALGVTGRSLCRVFAWIGDELRQYFVEANAELIGEMQRQAGLFMTRNVDQHIRPALNTDHPNAAATLARLFPGTDGTIRHASTNDEVWYTVLQDAQARAAHYEAVATGARLHLVEVMENASQLAFKDGQALRRAYRTRRGYTVEPTEYWDCRIAKLTEPNAAKPKRRAQS